MNYLRIKNWGEFQHYKDRRPPWIKLHRKVLESGEKFALLGELEQYQLVRLWVIAASVETFTRDDQGLTVPVLPHDEGTLRRSIMTLKRIPLERFIREGFLIEVAVQDVFNLEQDASAVASTEASEDASALVNAGASAQEQEVSEVSEALQHLGLNEPRASREHGRKATESESLEHQHPGDIIRVQFQETT